MKEAVEEVTSRLRQQENLIRTLHEQLADKVRVESDLRNATSVMADQIEDLKRELAEHDDVRAEERKNLEQEVTRLKERLQQETTSAFSWRKRYLLTQAQWTERSGELEAVVRQLRHELSALKSSYKQVDRENEKSKVELHRMSENTRKLLTSLDLGNECENANVALDFARSVSYTRRRRNGAPPNARTIDSTSQPPPLTETTDKSEPMKSLEKNVFRLTAPSNNNTSVARQLQPVFERRGSLPQHNRTPTLMTSSTLAMTSRSRRGTLPEANGMTSQSQRFLPPIDDCVSPPDVARASLG